KIQLEEDLRATLESLERTQTELNTDLDKVTSLDEETAMLEPQLDSVREQEELAGTALEEAEQAMLRWQGEWDQFNQESAGIQRKAEVEQQRINHLENIVDRGLARKNNLGRELEGLATDPESEQLALLEHNLGELSMQQGSLERDSAGLSGTIDATRQ